MTARESRAAAAAAGAGGSAAANPIMQIRGGRGLGRGGGFALSGSGIWEKFTQAEGAGTSRAGGPHRAQLGEGWRVPPPRQRSERWGARPPRPHSRTFPGTQSHTQLQARVRGNPGTQAPSARTHIDSQPQKHLCAHREACTHPHRGSASHLSQSRIAHTLTTCSRRHAQTHKPTFRCGASLPSHQKPPWTQD